MGPALGVRPPALCIFEARLHWLSPLRSSQLQQNAGENAAGIVMHGDAVVIALFEQLARPPERF